MLDFGTTVQLLADDLSELGTIQAARAPVRGDHIQFHGEWWVVTGVYLYAEGRVGVTFGPSEQAPATVTPDPTPYR